MPALCLSILQKIQHMGITWSDRAHQATPAQASVTRFLRNAPAKDTLCICILGEHAIGGLQPTLNEIIVADVCGIHSLSLPTPHGEESNRGGQGACPQQGMRESQGGSSKGCSKPRTFCTASQKMKTQRAAIRQLERSSTNVCCLLLYAKHALHFRICGMCCWAQGGGGLGTRPLYLIVCLWRRLLASRHCSF